jgi:hypothetical protein
MQTYLERYLDGDHLGVWTELVSLGPAVRADSVHEDAQAVAEEIFQRVSRNLTLVIGRLNELGYRFISPGDAWRKPDPEILGAISALEERYGSFPICLCKWFEIVGEVNLMGTHPRLSRHDGEDWGGSEKLGCYSDPLMIGWFNRLRTSLLSFHINLAQDWDEIERMEAENPPPYAFDIGLSAINKANQSGGGSVQMIVPNPGFDAPLIDPDLYWMGTFFVPHLRMSFEWGGFPGLGRLPESDQPWEELDFLTGGLLAF